uniref:Uncharacterized protein n=1 Tax=Candidatus Kentrum sp. LPFa TaxID=2126335 RepID=A0A450WRH8_9GAMM|nr:MAG: hypothetical protein BECKLPF1236B_GA0070989_11804 [Candidatus Kentron sp. LPFa]
MARMIQILKKTRKTFLIQFEIEEGSGISTIIKDRYFGEAAS